MVFDTPIVTHKTHKQTPRITLNYTNTTNNKRNKKISKEVFLFNFLALDFSHDQNEKRSESVTLFLDNFFLENCFLLLLMIVIKAR